ncbi:MAG: heavy metal translocating P-type ATPase [Bdellovibrionia bacterium]
MGKWIRLKIEGMSCASCVAHVEEALKKVPHVESVSVHLLGAGARVLLDGELQESLTAQVVDSLLLALRTQGYAASLLPQESSLALALQRHLQEASEKSKRRGRDAFFSLLLSSPFVVSMVGSFWNDSWMLPIGVQLVLATVVQWFFGIPFYVNSWRALRQGRGTMDLLVCLSTSVAWVISTQEALSSIFGSNGSAGHGYFESSAMIISFVLLGQWMESRAQIKAGGLLQALAQIRPDRARVLREDQPIELPIETVFPGERVLVRAGEKIPVDGQIVQGMASLDLSLITGESLPVVKTVGDSVFCGAINLDGLIILEVTSTGAQTSLEKMIQHVEQAQTSRAPLQKRVDQLSASLVGLVLTVAAFSFLAWGLLTGDWSQGIRPALSVLVISCPCALGLATPTAVSVGVGVGARFGILFRDFESLELLRQVHWLVWDKTGTLTEGHPALIEVIQASGEDPQEILAVACALQSGSPHPFARALGEEAQKRGLALEPPQEFAYHTGFGISASFKGRRFLLGSRRFLKEKGGISDGSLLPERDLAWKKAEERERQGCSLAWLAQVGQNGARVLGALVFRESLRPSAQEALERLKARGIRLVLMTGDREASARAIASQLGMDSVYFEALPQEKASKIQSLKQSPNPSGSGASVVAMVGDGVNDAAALASADVGISLASGTDVAKAVARVTLVGSDLNRVGDAIDLSEKTHRTIQIALFWAFLYNLLGIPLAALGYLTPILASAAMALSSVSVVSYALLLMRWRPTAVRRP